MSRELIEAYVTAETAQEQKLIEAAIVISPGYIFNDGVAYKRFSDLKFIKHPSAINLPQLSGSGIATVLKGISLGRQAYTDYPNGYGNSILHGSLFFSDGVGTYEVAITNDTGIDYNTPLTDDVIGYVPREMVDLIMVATQRLEPKH